MFKYVNIDYHLLLKYFPIVRADQTDKQSYNPKYNINRWPKKASLQVD